MGRFAILPALGYTVLATTPSTIYKSSNYVIHNENGLFHSDYSRTEHNSEDGCNFDDLPHYVEKTFPGEHETTQVKLYGTWHCKKHDEHNPQVNCELRCDDGYGPMIEHLKKTPESSDDDLVSDWKIRSKRVVCKNGDWIPAKHGKVLPRCHNTCGSLTLNNNDDSKAQLKCINLLQIHEQHGCKPGTNCHNGATCYPTCDKHFQTGKPKGDNEIQCICDHRKCGWHIPTKDLQQMGKCSFYMSSSNKRIIGGATADDEDTVEAKSNLSCGLLTQCKKRKKRAPGEDLIDHRREKRASCKSKMSWQHVCGGVLLTAQWAFTAAHCRTVGLRVILGEVDFDDRSGDEVPCRVRLQIRHPKYDGQTYHDIMMLNMMCRRLRMGDDIFPAKLPPPTSDVPWGAECKICGFGTMKYPEYAPATELQCLELPIMDREDCNGPYVGAIHDKIMCLGILGIGGQDSCQGDSGGGAYCNGICYGLVMGGLYCADEDYPGVYTIVAAYVPWAVTVIRVYISNNKRGSSKGRPSKGGKKGRRRRSAFTPPYIREKIVQQLGHDF